MATNTEDLTPIERACRAAGGQTKLAQLLGLSPTAVNQWVAHQRDPSTAKTRPIPEYRCVQIHQITGGAITYRELRPDLAGKWDLYEHQIGAQS